MKKYTRRHYNKKLLALGLSAFMGIGLISTGFAAWVMSKDENVEANGNVNVAVMQDSSISLKLWDPTDIGTKELTKDADGKFAVQIIDTSDNGAIVAANQAYHTAVYAYSEANQAYYVAVYANTVTAAN
jgi:hypothetical protein